MKKLTLATIAALFLATGTAHAHDPLINRAEFEGGAKKKARRFR